MAFQHSVTIFDPTGVAASAFFTLQLAVDAAVKQWSGILDGQGRLDIELRLEATDARITTTGLFSTTLQITPTQVFTAPNGLHELRTGHDVNGAGPDLVIQIDPGFFAGSTWLDPFPTVRVGAMPADKYDLVSLLTYQVGLGIGFTGYRDPSTGAVASNFVSPFDAEIQFIGDRPYFTGDHATAAYGGPVPLNTQTNRPLYVRLGNGPQDGLSYNAMTAEITQPGARHTVGTVDVAVMRDLGLAAVDLDTAPVFRFFNDVTGVHFYTAGADERDAVIAAANEFRYEGVAFGIPKAGQAPTATVWRFYNTETGTHFYTVSQTERDAVKSTLPQYEFEGPAYEAYTAPVPGSAPLWRFYNTDTGAHFYSASLIEANDVIARLPQYQFEGVAYYVDAFLL